MRRQIPYFCLVCGVDSREIRIFLIAVMGGLVLGAICISFWAWITGRFKNTDDLNNFAIKAEGADARRSPKERSHVD